MILAQVTELCVNAEQLAMAAWYPLWHAHVTSAAIMAALQAATTGYHRSAHAKSITRIISKRQSI